MKKGCLGRFVVFLLVVGFIGAAYGDYYFYTENQELRDRVARVEARLDQATADQRAHNLGDHEVASKPTPQSDGWLRQAQIHANNAAQALRTFDFPTAGREGSTALQDLKKAPAKMSAETRARYDSVNKQISGIQRDIRNVSDEANSAFHDITGQGGG